MNKLTVGFNLIDEGGNSFYQSTTTEVYRDLGDTDLDIIGRQLNCFLRQCGYARENSNILMEDITDEEYDALAAYLENLRGKSPSCVS